MLVTLLLSALGGCGPAAPPRPGPPVTLSLRTPADAGRTSSATLTVSGTVRPVGASVTVLGHRARVDGTGHFAAPVELAVGANLIDVVASAPRSPGAVAVVRVTRFLLVAVPDLSGEDPRQAAATLRALGLRPRVQSDSGPFSFLLPVSVKVCDSTPSPGARIDPGSVVSVRVAKLCGL